MEDCGYTQLLRYVLCFDVSEVLKECLRLRKNYAEWVLARFWVSWKTLPYAYDQSRK